MILTPNGPVSLGNHVTSLVCFSSVEKLVKHEKKKKPQNTMLLRAPDSPGLLRERVQVGAGADKVGLPPCPHLEPERGHFNPRTLHS